MNDSIIKVKEYELSADGKTHTITTSILNATVVVMEFELLRVTQSWAKW